MTIKVFNRLDIVINNAGVMNDRFWELEVDVNLVSEQVTIYLSPRNLFASKYVMFKTILTICFM